MPDRATQPDGAPRHPTVKTTRRGMGSTVPSRFDSQFTTGTAGLTNARTRIVGERTGFLADAVIALVRLARAVGGFTRRVFARMAAVITLLGWSVLVLVPLSLLLGYIIGWIELIVVGFAGVALIVIAVIYLVGRSSIQIELNIPHRRVIAGDHAVGEVVISNGLHRRTLGVTIEIPVGPGLAEVALPSLRKGRNATHNFTIPTTRRGVVPVGPVRTVRADPIGLVRRELVWTEVHELFVHPRTVAIPSMSTGFIRDLEGNPTRDLSSNDVSFHALREYMPGDERRNIHWKSTARTGTYMVRQFEETRRSHLMIALSLASADYATDDEFELAVSVTGSLGIRAIRDTRTVTVVASEDTPQFAKRKVFAVRLLSTLTRTRLLDDLAVVEHTESALPMADVARVAGEQASGVSVAFLVCGSSVTRQQLRAASTKFPLGVEVVAVVCDPESAPGLRRIAGLSVLTIGYLDDLKQSLARAAAA